MPDLAVQGSGCAGCACSGTSDLNPQRAAAFQTGQFDFECRSGTGPPRLGRHSRRPPLPAVCGLVPTVCPWSTLLHCTKLLTVIFRDIEIAQSLNGTPLPVRKTSDGERYLEARAAAAAAMRTPSRYGAGQSSSNHIDFNVARSDWKAQGAPVLLIGARLTEGSSSC